jgi:hypothetical protein
MASGAGKKLQPKAKEEPGTMILRFFVISFLHFF